MKKFLDARERSAALWLHLRCVDFSTEWRGFIVKPEDIERNAALTLSRLWRTIAGDLPHPSKVMRYWYLDIEDWQTVSRVRLTAGQDAPWSLMTRVVETMQSEGMATVELKRSSGRLVHTTFRGSNVAVLWDAGIFFLIVDSKPVPLLEDEGQAPWSRHDQFVPYIEDETNEDSGPLPRVRDSAAAVARMTDLVEEFRESREDIWRYKRKERTELQGNLDALDQRAAEGSVWMKIIANLLAAPAVGLIALGLLSIFLPVIKLIAIICVTEGVLGTLTCTSTRALTFGWYKIRVISMSVLMLIFGLVAFVWKQPELVTYACIALESAIAVRSIYLIRGISQTLRSYPAWRDDLRSHFGDSLKYFDGML